MESKGCVVSQCARDRGVQRTAVLPIVLRPPSSSSSSCSSSAILVPTLTNPTPDSTAVPECSLAHEDDDETDDDRENDGRSGEVGTSR